MLALLQRFITFWILASAFGWLFYFDASAPVLAWAGFIAIVFGHSVVLAAEFRVARHVNQKDPGPQATCRECMGAWWLETVTTPQVFCWRQPFRANAAPDQLGPPERVHGRRGVVFIHGLFCNRGFWTPWLNCLQGRGNAFVALNLEPLLGSIDGYVPQVEEAVERVTQATGLAPLLVCHSMGGLAARAWLNQMKAVSRVHHLVTIGTPHQGTWMARFGQGQNGRQMRLLSSWRAQLDHDMPAGAPALFTCWYSNCDNIVFPASNATLPGARNRLVRGAAHVQLAFAPEVMQATLALLDQPLP